MPIACYRSTSSCSSRDGVSRAALSGAPPIRSNRQAPPDSASHENTQVTNVVDTKSAAGAAIHRLRQLKQSIRLPTNPSPTRRRNRNMTSAGPSSFASRCVTRQVARTARRTVSGTVQTRSPNARRCRRSAGPRPPSDRSGRWSGPAGSSATPYKSRATIRWCFQGSCPRRPGW